MKLQNKFEDMIDGCFLIDNLYWAIKIKYEALCYFFYSMFYYFRNRCLPKEVWAFDYYTAKYIVKRLRIYRKDHFGCPAMLDEKEWDKILDKIIDSFEKIIDDEYNITEKEMKRIQKGLDLFSKYYLNLWD